MAKLLKNEKFTSAQFFLQKVQYWYLSDNFSEWNSLSSDEEVSVKLALALEVFCVQKSGMDFCLKVVYL